MEDGKITEVINSQEDPSKSQAVFREQDYVS
jgi:hypothetical protein